MHTFGFRTENTGNGTQEWYSILNSVPAIMIMQDREHNILWVNSDFLRSSGLRAEEVLGRKCYSLWGKDSVCEKCPAVETLKTGLRAEKEYYNDSDFTSPFPFSDYVSRTAPVSDQDGGITGIIETVCDLSDKMSVLRMRERTMEALLRLFEFATSHSSQELLREFLDEAERLTDSEIGFFHFVKDDQETLSLQTWSSNTMKFCSAPGAGTHYLIKQAGVWVDCVREGRSVVHNDYAGLKHKKGLPEGHVPLVRELVVPVKRGSKLVAILGVGNKGSNYTEYDVKVVEQLAELAWETVVGKRSEEEYKKLQLQYAQSRKMESIGRLAGGVAHDFNNMLSVILGRVDMALEKMDQSDPMYDTMLEICKAAERSANLTHQLLTFARKQTIAPQKLNLNKVIGEMLRMLERVIGENIELKWLPEDGLGLVKMDPGQVEQIFMNLCVNARDAIVGAGKVTIETQNVFIDDEYARGHSGFIPGSYVMIAVSDDGCGIEPELMTKLFEPFFTTKKIGEGTGLGLATVYGIVKQNDGFINVYSEPGKGTTFKIYLTRHRGQESVAGKTERSFPGRGELVLLVEDELMILSVSKAMLESLGYRVITANTPGEALKKADASECRVDLLLTDVVMPEMTGSELAAKLRELYPDFRTLYMSGYTADVIAHHGVLKEGINFLQKPFTKNELSAKIIEALDSDSF